MYSLIIPVFKNEESIRDLIHLLKELDGSLERRLEAIFVVDGSPDQSYARLREALPDAGFDAKLLLLSRNFGSFAAIRVGLEKASGPYFAVMSADLQEPLGLVLEFFRSIEREAVDVVIGTRERRGDPMTSRLAASLFWFLYRKFVVPDMPIGGVDVFGCNKDFRDQLLCLEESHSSLIAQLFWLGFRRKQINYSRLARQHGKSAWTFRKKIHYLMDSVFAFTDLPIQLLIVGGGVAFGISLLLGIATVVSRITGWITVPGYAATMVAVLFFGTLNVLGLGLVGSYAWRAYENTKRRPLAIPLTILEYHRTLK